MTSRSVAAILMLLAIGLPAARLWTAAVWWNPMAADGDRSMFYIVKHRPSWQSRILLDEKSPEVTEVGTPVFDDENGLLLVETYLGVMALVPVLSPVFAVLAILLYLLAASRRRAGQADRRGAPTSLRP